MSNIAVAGTNSAVIMDKNIKLPNLQKSPTKKITTRADNRSGISKETKNNNFTEKRKTNQTWDGNGNFKQMEQKDLKLSIGDYDFKCYNKSERKNPTYKPVQTQMMRWYYTQYLLKNGIKRPSAGETNQKFI